LLVNSELVLWSLFRAVWLFIWIDYWILE